MIILPLGASSFDIPGLSVWFGVLIIISFRGYQRRTCRTPRMGTNKPNSPPRADGLYTVGIQDFNILVPDSTVVGCAAMCGEGIYPRPPPPDPQTAVAVRG